MVCKLLGEEICLTTIGTRLDGAMREADAFRDELSTAVCELEEGTQLPVEPYKK